jgi:hypothetical protein
MAIHFYSQNAGLNIDDILCRTIDPIITKCGVFKNSQRCISVDSQQDWKSACAPLVILMT